ncbi:MAG: MBL fold metallo-hydrolase [bacterium]
MTIQKYLHSCILLQEGDTKLLFDPGKYCFLEKKITPADIGEVDIIVLTHQHADHYWPEALHELVAMHQPRIICSEEIGELLKEEDLEYEVIQNEEKKEIGDFTIQAFEAEHGPLPVPICHNFAFLINGKFLHPGDSYSVRGVDKCEVLALPIAAPWSKLVDPIEWVKRLRPGKVIPIHDAYLKDYSRQGTFYKLAGQIFEQEKIDFQPLELGDKLDI